MAAIVNAMEAICLWGGKRRTCQNPNEVKGNFFLLRVMLCGGKDADPLWRNVAGECEGGYVYM